MGLDRWWRLLVLVSTALLLGCGDGGDPDGEPDGAVSCPLVEIASEVRVSAAPGSSLSPALAAGAGGFGLVWYDERNRNETFFARLEPDGDPSTGEVRISPVDALTDSPVIAWSGREFGVAWTGFVGANFEVFYRPVSPAGEPAALPTQVSENPWSSQRPAITFGAGTMRVTWVEAIENGTNEEIYTARVDPGGTVLGDDLRVTEDTATSYAPTIASGAAGQYAIAWHDWRAGNGDLYLARFDPGGEKLAAETPITFGPEDSFVPVLVWGDGEWGAAWHDNQGSSWQIYFARVTAAGAPIGDPVRISTGALDATFAALVWTGAEYLIAWQENSATVDRILLSRLSREGVRVGVTLEVTASPGAAQPTLAWTGTTLGVAWQDNRDGNYEIYFSSFGCDQRTTRR